MYVLCDADLQLITLISCITANTNHTVLDYMVTEVSQTCSEFKVVAQKEWEAKRVKEGRLLKRGRHPRAVPTPWFLIFFF